MPAYDATRALAPDRSKLRFAVLQFHQMPLAHASEDFRRRLIRQHGQASCWATGLQRFDQRRLASLAAHPDLLEEVIEADFVFAGHGGRRRRAAVVGIRQRALQRMTWAV